MPKKNVFTCRVFRCGSHSCHEVRESTDFVGQQTKRVLYYVCEGCSVHFDDPEKFSSAPPSELDAQTDKMLAEELDNVM